MQNNITCLLAGDEYSLIQVLNLLQFLFTEKYVWNIYLYIKVS